MKDLIELLTGFSDPKTVFRGKAPVGENGLMVRIRSIAYLATAVRCFERERFRKLGMKYAHDVFRTFYSCMRQEWQSEIMRLMDVASIERKKIELENLTVRLMSKRFQQSSDISDSDKAEERRLFTALTDHYDIAGYKEFRDKFIAHIDLEHALKPDGPGIGNLFQTTDLILAWFKHVGTVVMEAEPKVTTVGGRKYAREMVRSFRHMMFDQVRHRRHRHRQRTRKARAAAREAAARQ